MARFRVKNKQLMVLKPSTFMNLSGVAVRYWMNKERLPLQNLLVIVDDLALPFGAIRLRGSGSDTGVLAKLQGPIALAALVSQ